jgi:DNA-binding transcriptional LysR family regulator
MPADDLLASFVTLAADLHFTRAAERLHVAQPALTKRIQQLEDALDVRLFTRTRRTVSLTAAGELLLPYARRALDARRELESAARRLRDGEIGRLRVGFSPSAPHHILPSLMRAFRKQRPGLDCVLTELPTDVQIEQLLAGEIDVGLLRQAPVFPQRLTCVPLLEEPFVVVLPREHRLARRRSIALRDLAAETLVLVSRRMVAGVHDQILGACASVGVTPAAVREATHVHGVVSLVAAGCGVSVLPRSASQVGVTAVVCRPLRDPAVVTRIAVAHLHHGASSAARAFAAEAARRFGHG